MDKVSGCRSEIRNFVFLIITKVNVIATPFTYPQRLSFLFMGFVRRIARHVCPSHIFDTIHNEPVYAYHREYNAPLFPVYQESLWHYPLVYIYMYRHYSCLDYLSLFAFTVLFPPKECPCTRSCMTNLSISFWLCMLVLYTY